MRLSARKRQHADRRDRAVDFSGRLAAGDVPAAQGIFLLMARDKRLAIAGKGDSFHGAGEGGTIAVSLAGKRVPESNRLVAAAGQELTVPAEGDGFDFLPRKRQPPPDLARGDFPEQHFVLAPRGEPVAVRRIAGGKQGSFGLPATQLLGPWPASQKLMPAWSTTVRVLPSGENRIVLTACAMAWDFQISFPVDGVPGDEVGLLDLLGHVAAAALPFESDRADQRLAIGREIGRGEVFAWCPMNRLPAPSTSSGTSGYDSLLRPVVDFHFRLPCPGRARPGQLPIVPPLPGQRLFASRQTKPRPCGDRIPSRKFRSWLVRCSCRSGSQASRRLKGC